MCFKKGSVRLFTFLFIFPAIVFSQEKIFEKVEVVNIELIARVKAGAKSLSGLRASDFLLYEDGRRVEITSCREVRRTMSAPITAAPVAAPKPGRLFLIMLWLNEESPSWRRAWERFKKEVYRPGDRVVLQFADRLYDMRTPSDIEAMEPEWLEQLASHLRMQETEKSALTQALENAAADFYHDLQSLPEGRNEIFLSIRKAMEPGLFMNFKGCYLGALNEFKLRRARDLRGRLERFAASLKTIEADKWVLVFLQNEQLPLLTRYSRLTREGRMLAETIYKLRELIEESEREILMARDVVVSARDLRPIFIGANATFHLFLADTATKSGESEYLTRRRVFSDWEAVYRSISADTGGRVTDSTDLDKALSQAAGMEDVYYVLTYQPNEKGGQERKLRLETRLPGRQVIFSRRVTLGELFPLAIGEPRWEGGRLLLSLSGYQRFFEGEGLRASLKLQVTAQGPTPLALEFSREFRPLEEAVTVDMALNFPQAGRYRLDIVASDELSGNQVDAKLEIEIPLPPAMPPAARAPEGPPVEAAVDPALGGLLTRAAAYCEKLKQVAMHFFCLEVVTENFLEKNPLNKRVERLEKRWEYDYQVVMKGGSINERRVLLRENRRKVRVENASLSTRFASLYSVYMPVTLLAAENRSMYAYKLLDREKMKGRRCAVLEAVPRSAAAAGTPQGRIWVDESDGSVLKIEISPRGVVGVETLEKAAQAMSARLLLEVTHLYLVERAGIRFPSATEFREAYVFEKTLIKRKLELPYSTSTYGVEKTVVDIPTIEQQRREVEFYRLNQEYRKYRFFTVESKEKIIDPVQDVQ